MVCASLTAHLNRQYSGHPHHPSSLCFQEGFWEEADFSLLNIYSTVKSTNATGPVLKLLLRGQTFKMLSKLNGMYKPHHHRTAFMNDLGDGLKVKFWCILKRMRAKHWDLAFYVFPFVKRKISVIQQGKFSLLWGCLQFRDLHSWALLENSYSYKSCTLSGLLGHISVCLNHTTINWPQRLF